MSNQGSEAGGGKGAFPRERTATRMRFVAPPGMELEKGPSSSQTIGRYEILETLGKGAMGVVYKARDPLLDRTVAVKTIVSPKHGGRRVRRAYLERFEREAKAAAKMQHPAIVTIFDVGSTDEGAPFMVLEYLPGESLADRCDRVRIPLGRAVQIGIDLASALGFAHKVRIVHRDVKPANVLHAGENRWKLADFGIARMPDSDLTQVGIFMGTPGYAPPEAIQHGSYTPQADVFAWGAVLYELLSGRIAYEGPDTQTTNGYVLDAKAPPPTHYDPSIPGPLASVVMRALDPSVEVRYRDGLEAEQALQRAWERCLSSNLVAPAALVAQEMPHAKAPRAFHQPSLGGPNSDDVHTKPALKAAPPGPYDHSVLGGPFSEPDLVAPSAKSIEAAISAEVAEFSDTGKTVVDGSIPLRGTHEFAAAREGVSALPGADTTVDTLEQPVADPLAGLGNITDAEPVVAEPPRAETGRVREESMTASPRMSVWLAVIAIAMIAGTAAAWVLLKL